VDVVIVVEGFRGEPGCGAGHPRRGLADGTRPARLVGPRL